MKKLFLLAFIGATLLSCQPQAPKETSSALSIASPASAGFSAERLARIDSTMQDWVDKGWNNGSVGFIARNGKIVYYKAAGYNDIEAKEALDKEGIFRIASQTKAITSVAVMMLYEEGKFLLDEPVSKYIPSFKDLQVLDKFNEKDTTYTTVPATRAITIRDLLTHTSGLDYATIGSEEAKAIYAKNDITAGLDVYEGTLQEAMARLGGLPLMHQPGEKWTYSLSVDLLGALIEIWSGMSLEAFFNKRIFQPLRMNETYFNVPEAKADRLVNFFLEGENGIEKSDKALGGDMNFPLRQKSYFSGGGGLSSTIYDYAIFLQMLLNEGEYDGAQLLARNTVRMMTMNQIGELNLGVNKFGLGFEIVSADGSSKSPSREGTYSWGGAFSTSYWVDPKEKMVILYYQQMWGKHTGETGNLFKVLAYQALVE